MIKIYENEIKLPICPKTEKPTNWKSKTITKLDADGYEYVFHIIPSKTSATNYIYDSLSNMSFPWCRNKYDLQDYINDPEYYKEDMLNWWDRESNYIDDSQMTFIDFGNTYVVLEDDGLQGAITAYKKARNVQKICHSNCSDMILYNGYVYYEDDGDGFGMWRGSTDLPNERNYKVNFDDYEWENIGGTYVQKFNPQST